MKTYREFRPTQFDTNIPFRDHRDEWLVGPLSTNRDVPEAHVRRWGRMVEKLQALDPDGEQHEIHRYGHWGCGWFEIVIVAPGSKAAKYLARMEKRRQEMEANEG